MKEGAGNSESGLEKVWGIKVLRLRLRKHASKKVSSNTHSLMEACVASPYGARSESSVPFFVLSLALQEAPMDFTVTKGH